MKVMDGRWEMKGLMTMLHHHKHCDTILAWLVRNELTGRVFIEWFHDNFAPNPKRMIHYILSNLMSNGRVHHG